MNPVVWCEYQKIMNTTKNVLFDPLCTARQCGFLFFVKDSVTGKLQTKSASTPEPSPQLFFHVSLENVLSPKIEDTFPSLWPYLSLFFWRGELPATGWFLQRVYFGYIPIIKNVPKILVLIIIIHPFCVCVRGLGVTLQQDLTLIWNPRPKLVSKKRLVVTESPSWVDFLF